LRRWLHALGTHLVCSFPYFRRWLHPLKRGARQALFFFFLLWRCLGSTPPLNPTPFLWGVRASSNFSHLYPSQCVPCPCALTGRLAPFPFCLLVNVPRVFCKVLLLPSPFSLFCPGPPAPPLFLPVRSHPVARAPCVLAVPMGTSTPSLYPPTLVNSLPPRVVRSIFNPYLRFWRLPKTVLALCTRPCVP